MCLSKVDDHTCTVMMAKRLMEEEEAFNAECADQMEHLIEKRW